MRIRTRIALLVSAISIGLLIVMAVAVYIVFDRQLQANLDDTIGLRSAANRQLVDLSHTPPALVATGDADREQLEGEAVLRLYASDGSVLHDASPATGVTDEERQVVLAAVASGHDVYRTIDLSDDEDYRVVASPIEVAETTQVVLVTGLEYSRVDGPLSILRVILLIAIPSTAIAAGIGGYWVARRALRPVAAMTSTANLIARGDLHRRVPGESSPDELGQLATTLNFMIARLDEAVERERRFTADAAHELRTPLAAIDAGIDVTLAHRRTEDEYRRVLAVVRGQAQRLNRLARQLLLLSRLDADQMRASFCSLELGSLLETVVEAFSDAHRDATIRLSLPVEPCQVRGDPELLARAVMNLLENTIVHVGESVTVGVVLQCAGGANARISVRDDGAGVPVHLAGDLFLRFRRGDAARTRGGTGLGLAIVDAIARCHGGRIELDEPGDGSGACFSLSIPRADSVANG